jgi:hypothetical protein
MAHINVANSEMHLYSDVMDVIFTFGKSWVCFRFGMKYGSCKFDSQTT